MYLILILGMLGQAAGRFDDLDIVALELEGKAVALQVADMGNSGRRSYVRMSMRVFAVQRLRINAPFQPAEELMLTSIMEKVARPYDKSLRGYRLNIPR